MTDVPAADGRDAAASTTLTVFQIEVAQAFFALTESEGFSLAGGAALAAHGMTARPTQDLDLFTAPGRGVVLDALRALEGEAGGRGWATRRVREAGTFARLLITSGDDVVLVDLAVDASTERTPVMSIAGPTLDPDDLAGRKVVALFDRAEARDFVDVYALVARYGTARLLDLAAAVDPGFDIVILADMLDSLSRFDDDEIPAPAGDATAIRAFFADWSAKLRR